MSQVPVNKEYRTFVKGLITEASPLTFPENASLEEDNFELNSKGYRSRRLGLDYEASYTLRSTGKVASVIQDEAISLHKWENANNDGSLIVLVVQIGLNLYFYDATQQPITGAPLNSGNAITVTGDKSFSFEFTNIAGNLIVVTGGGVIYQLEYDDDADAITYIQHGLLVRDIWGVDDGRDISERSTSFTTSTLDTFYYNMGNQGWEREHVGAPALRSYRSSFFTDIGKYPSNVDRVSSGIDTSSNNDFSSNLVAKAISGTTPAPKGSFIIDAFERGASRVHARIGGLNYFDTTSSSGIGPDYSILNNYGLTVGGWNEEDVNGNKKFGAFSLLSAQLAALPVPFSSLTLPADKTNPSIKCVTSYAGRVFYSGFDKSITEPDSRSPDLSTYIFYSQVVDGVDKIGKCYQEGDPASAANFDLVATDGGSIKIIGASSIVKLVPFANSLLVFSNNGVWEIKGGEKGFSATENQVVKISDIGVVSKDSIVVAEDKVLFWATSGIYGIVRENTGLRLIIENITSSTIQTYYNSIPNTGKTTVRGTYSKEDKKIVWIYNDSATYTSTSDRYVYNRQITFDTSIGAFYTSTFGTDATDTEYPRVAGVFSSPNFSSSTYEEQVTVGVGNNVQVSAENVIVGSRAISGSLTKLNYLCVKPDDSTAYTYTVGLLSDPTFVDWTADTSTAIDAGAFIETGYEILNDSQRKKQIQYITTHMERTESGFNGSNEAVNPSSCLLQVKWDFADHANSGKLGDPIQIYRLPREYMTSGSLDEFNQGQKVITSKNKIRGRGRSLRMRFSSEAGKNCVLYGWGAVVLGNSDV